MKSKIAHSEQKRQNTYTVMADKKVTKKPVEAAQEAAAAKSAEKKVRESKQLFEAVDPETRTDVQKAAKALPPQAKIIVDVVTKAKSIGRADLYAALPGAGLVTRQPVERIVAFYLKRLVEEGYIRVIG